VLPYNVPFHLVGIDSHLLRNPLAQAEGVVEAVSQNLPAVDSGATEEGVVEGFHRYAGGNDNGVRAIDIKAVGDAQLARFIKNPANSGKIMQSGLWAYTRHPNYFGEVTQWWGIWLIALAVTDGWLGIIGPITITFLILKVSGIPLLEKKMAENPDFTAYKKRVSVFVPLPPKVIAKK